MSFLDKITDAIAPPESPEDRAEARAELRAIASTTDWIGTAVAHHEQIEIAFDTARSAHDAGQARDAVRMLGAVLTAHSIAEEVVLYPALVTAGYKINAAQAYQEQQMAKVQMAELEKLAPLGEEWVDKLEHIRGAVLHHIYEEESAWFRKIAEDSPADEQAEMSARFAEEYERYMAGV